MLDGNAGMFRMDGHHSFYPMVVARDRHPRLSRLVPEWSRPPTLCCSWLPLVWLIGAKHLAQVSLPEVRGSVYLVPGGPSIFPIRLLTDTAVSSEDWPPARPQIAWAVAARRRAAWLITVSQRRPLIVLAAPAAAVMGSVVTHPGDRDHHRLALGGRGLDGDRPGEGSGDCVSMIALLDDAASC